FSRDWSSDVCSSDLLQSSCHQRNHPFRMDYKLRMAPSFHRSFLEYNQLHTNHLGKGFEDQRIHQVEIHYIPLLLVEKERALEVHSQKDTAYNYFERSDIVQSQLPQLRPKLLVLFDKLLHLPMQNRTAQEEERLPQRFPQFQKVCFAYENQLHSSHSSIHH